MGSPRDTRPTSSVVLTRAESASNGFVGHGRVFPSATRLKHDAVKHQPKHRGGPNGTRTPFVLWNFAGLYRPHSSTWPRLSPRALGDVSIGCTGHGRVDA